MRINCFCNRQQNNRQASESDKTYDRLSEASGESIYFSVDRRSLEPSFSYSNQRRRRWHSSASPVDCSRRLTDCPTCGRPIDGLIGQLNRISFAPCVHPYARLQSRFPAVHRSLSHTTVLNPSTHAPHSSIPSPLQASSPSSFRSPGSVDIVTLWWTTKRRGRRGGSASSATSGTLPLALRCPPQHARARCVEISQLTSERTDERKKAGLAVCHRRR